MHPEEEGLLRAISANPEDNGPYRIYADWLAEHSRPELAEFIHIEIALSEMEFDDPRYSDLDERWIELYDEHMDDWFDALPHVPGIVWDDREEDDAPSLEKGLPVYLRAETWEALRTAGARLLELYPITHLVIGRLGSREAARWLAAWPPLSRIHILDLTRAGLDAEQMAILGGSRHLGRLERLVLRGNDISGKGVEALTRSPHLTNLGSLDLTGNVLSVYDLRALARCRHLARVQVLALGATLGRWGWSEVADQGLEALLDQPTMRPVTLYLDHNLLTDQAARTLAGSATLAELSVLDLRSNRLTDEGASALAGSSHLPARLTLFVAGNRITPAGAQTLRARFLRAVVEG
jgi:uncharacterized protein (TIGR02996 family)